MEIKSLRMFFSGVPFFNKTERITIQWPTCRLCTVQMICGGKGMFQKVLFMLMSKPMPTREFTVPVKEKTKSTRMTEFLWRDSGVCV